MSSAENKRIMARNIRFYMACRGVTKTQMCEALGFKYSTVTDWLLGKTYPRIMKIEAMANYFGCDKSDLIEDTGKVPDENDELYDKKVALIQFAYAVPKENVDMALRVMQSIAEG